MRVSEMDNASIEIAARVFVRECAERNITWDY
jgi:hypothetical protein